MKLRTPILFLTFNRLDFTKQSFQAISRARPEKLYFASDGPRDEEEKEIVNSVRSYVLNNVDWECNVKTLFRDKNLGCKEAVSGAIDWLFDHENQGIILEDDCVPNQSFFKYCQICLNKYKNFDEVMSISGNNPLGKINSSSSYIFSQYCHIWGWATWKSQWRKIDFGLESFSNIKNEIYPNFIERILRKKKYRNYKEKNDTWDIPWDLTHQIEGGYSIIPKKNLVRNIGFEDNNTYTHTKPNFWDKKYLLNSSFELEFPLKHPAVIQNNKNYKYQYLTQEIKRISCKKIFNPFWRRKY